jgi:hypothetical protein
MENSGVMGERQVPVGTGPHCAIFLEREGVKVLMATSRDALSLDDISAACGMSRTTAFRTVSRLLEMELVEVVRTHGDKNRLHFLYRSRLLNATICIDGGRVRLDIHRHYEDPSSRTLGVMDI